MASLKNDEGFQAFLKKLIKICELLGDGNVESDDGGDRWIQTCDSKFHAEIRARYIGSIPVWEIEIRSAWRYSEVVKYNIERSNNPNCGARNCGHEKSDHESKGKQGCQGIAGYQRETNSHIRCHCMNF